MFAPKNKLNVIIIMLMFGANLLVILAFRIKIALLSITAICPVEMSLRTEREP